MIAGMINDVNHLLPERMGEWLASPVDIRDSLPQAVRRERLKEAAEVLLDGGPSLTKGIDRREVRGGEHLAGRASEPALKPDPLGAEDVGHSVTHGAEAVAHIAGELLRGERSNGSQCALVGPVIVKVEFMNGFRLHGCDWHGRDPMDQQIIVLRAA